MQPVENMPTPAPAPAPAPTPVPATVPVTKPPVKSRSKPIPAPGAPAPETPTPTPAPAPATTVPVTVPGAQPPTLVPAAAPVPAVAQAQAPTPVPTTNMQGVSAVIPADGTPVNEPVPYTSQLEHLKLVISGTMAAAEGIAEPSARLQALNDLAVLLSLGTATTVKVQGKCLKNVGRDIDAQVKAASAEATRKAMSAAIAKLSSDMGIQP